MPLLGNIFVLNIMAVSQDNAPLLIGEFLLGLTGAWLVSRYAPCLGLIDAPSARSSHVLPTAKGGGIGILAAFVMACLILGINHFLLIAATFLALLSLLGDRRHLAPGLRLILQFVAAFVVLLPYLSFGAYFSLPVSLPDLVIGGMALIFIVGTANFYNFMDGINGIAAITAVVAFGLLAGYGACSGQDSRYVLLSMGMALASLGFLPFNIPTARVFMGDVGSILLGFVFAVLVIIFAQTLTEFLVLSSFMFPFYADELLTMVERIRLRQGLTCPHRRHLYQVLANEGNIPHWQIAVIYGSLQLIVGGGVWLLADFGELAVMALLFTCSSVFFMVNLRVKNRYLVPS